MKKLKFGSGENSFSEESKCYISNSYTNSFEYLLFVDSRGLVINENNFENTYMYKIMNFFNNSKISYICISRPKNLTVYASLYNFIQLNPSLSFKNLITNLGFVDCTPKKESNIKDIEEQIDENIKIRLGRINQEQYMLNNGEQEMLATISYNSKYIYKIVNLLNSKFEKLYFINTPKITNDINFERKRPNSFFFQLEKTNNLIESIIENINKPVKLINIKSMVSTYDGVHFNKNGHEKIFIKLKEGISK